MSDEQATFETEMQEKCWNCSAPPMVPTMVRLTVSDERPKPVRAEFLPNLAGDREYARVLSAWRLDRYRAALKQIAAKPEHDCMCEPSHDVTTPCVRIAREALAEEEPKS